MLKPVAKPPKTPISMSVGLAQGVGDRISDFGFRACGFRVQGLGFRSFGFRVKGCPFSGFLISGFGCGGQETRSSTCGV
jgi:hypothetical protein